jgi:hypothetical protein
MKGWRCAVCGYEATGDEPPAQCPVCGVDRSKFEAVAPPAHPAAAGPARAPEFGPPVPAPAREAESEVRAADFWSFLKRQAVRKRAHPISAHVPNGVLPAATILLLLGLVFSHVGLRNAAFYNLVMVVLAMPAVSFTGYLDWKANYGGAYSTIIVTKIVCAAVVFVVGVVLVLWGIFAEATGFAYFVLHLIMLAAAAIAGYMGGKLVFGNDGKRS